MLSEQGVRRSYWALGKWESPSELSQAGVKAPRLNTLSCSGARAPFSQHYRRDSVVRCLQEITSSSWHDSGVEFEWRQGTRIKGHMTVSAIEQQENASPALITLHPVIKEIMPRSAPAIPLWMAASHHSSAASYHMWDWRNPPTCNQPWGISYTRD